MEDIRANSVENIGELDTFFSKFSESWGRFAEHHNLQVVKYWHQEPGWRFNFQHPKGGEACIEILRVEGQGLRVYAYWWVDDYGEGTRTSKRNGSDVISGDQFDVQILEDLFVRVVSWELDDSALIVNGDFRQVWSRWSKESFEKLHKQFPVPKL
jgi:hypothetical protein